MTAKKKAKVIVDLTETSPVHLACRDFKHAWQWSTDFIPREDVKRGKITSVARVLVCTRCMTERRDVYAVPSMEHVSSTYAYPEGYLIPGPHGRIYVSTVRSEVLRRMQEKGGAKWQRG